LLILARITAAIVLHDHVFQLGLSDLDIVHRQCRELAQQWSQRTFDLQIPQTRPDLDGLPDRRVVRAGSLELARRAASENAATPLGDILESLKDEIEDDRASLNTIMTVLEVSPDRLKNAAAWAGEKAGRLKLNGRLTSYSPLSPVVELEALIAGVTGKRALWRTLSRLAGDDPRLQADQLGELLARADRQLETLWSVHSDASHAALADAD